MNGAGQAGPAEAGPSIGPARVKKKAKPTQGKAVARKNTIPKPYLALAPAPVSLSGSRFHEAVSTSSLGNLVLPSSYPRGAGLATPPLTGQTAMTASGPSRHAPTGKTRKYAAGLLAPPAIMPGGVSVSPRVQAPARNGRRTPGGDTPEGYIRQNRSSERLRQISGSGANASMMSLGHIGRILQSDPAAPPPIQLQDNGPVPEQVSTRRRRRIVRAEDDTLRRRLTVSTREEGRAIGLARGASMRRVNVWDDLPESSDPPPAFPFPTTATSRLPPTFETAQSSPPATSPDERPRSPPPSFEQAIGLVPLPGPLAVVNEADEDEPAAQLPSVQEPGISRPSTPATDYASAPESPSGSTAPLPEPASDEDRSDRKMWNMDLLSGYSLEERVRREIVRRKSRVEDTPLDIPTAGTSSAESSEQLAEDLSIQEAATVVSTATATPTRDSRPRPVINTSEAGVVRNVGSSSPARASPTSASTSRASTRTLHLSRSTSRLPTSPKTPTNTSSPSKDLIMASTIANPPTAVKLPSSPISPTFPGSPLATLRQSVQSPKTPDPDAVVDQSPSARKLSRGHAIRRSSSVLKSDTGSMRSRRSADSPKQPLFSSPGLTAAQILESPEPHRVAFEHRASEPPPVPSTLQGMSRLHQRTKSQPNLQRITEDGAADVLPPHREAALKRRDLGVTRIDKTVPQANSSAPTSPVKGKVQPSGPLIDFNHTLPVIAAQPPAPALGEHSAWTTELLQLLDEVQSPVAESSSQGAARTAAAAIVNAEVEAAVEAKVNAERVQQSAQPAEQPSTPSETAPSSTPSSTKRAPPPPPPLSLRLKRQQGTDKSPSGVVRRLSVLSTANSPIIPYTARSSTLKTQDQDSPTAALRGQSAPTRRPPPLPPVKFQPLAPAGPSGPSPSPPPSFPGRPNISHVASFSTSESSEEATAERPPMRRPYTSLATRPRGPRPPPVPTRPWSKVVSQTWEEPQRASPVLLSPPGQALNIRTDVERPQPPRSASVQDLRSPRRQRSDGRSPLEFTDLDVFVSRLEGSGREYEGFAQITSFLGPGKPTAATPAQIATLLPGLVSVDSRRTTAQGKVKLKLSLLGVRVSKCPICLSQFKDKDTGVMLPECGHVAHQVCATRWFRDESRCFVCREALKEG